MATDDEYVQIDVVPDGVRWTVGPKGRPSKTQVVLFSVGRVYKLVRTLKTGEVKYYRLRDTGPEMTPAEQIDTEPTRGAQVRYRTGTQAWFLDVGRWFLIEVVSRTRAAGTGVERRITIRSVTGFDAERSVPWPYGELLEFPAYANNILFQRLRPLRDRQP